MNEQELAQKGFGFGPVALVGQHFSVDPNYPTGGIYGRQCLRCRDILIFDSCSNCGHYLYKSSDSRIWCTKCEMGLSQWSCNICQTVNPISKTFITISSNKGGCFVATVAFGDYGSPEVQFLTRFRDTVLSKSVLGRSFITTYYLVGPYLASIIGKSSALRLATRRLFLRPLIFGLKILCRQAS